MRALGFEPRKEEIKKMVSEVDREATGRLSFDAFLALMASKGGTKGNKTYYFFSWICNLPSPQMSEKDSKEEILKAFKLFDDDDTGRISFANLKRVADELGESLTDEELKEMIGEADRSGEGEVNQEDFLRIMKKTSLY